MLKYIMDIMDEKIKVFNVMHGRYNNKNKMEFVSLGWFRHIENAEKAKAEVEWDGALGPYIVQHLMHKDEAFEKCKDM